MISILTFKPVLIGCQYGLYVVYGAPAAKETQKQGALTFEIEKGRLSFRPTAPYSAERRKIYSKNAKEKGMKGSAEYSFEIKKIT